MSFICKKCGSTEYKIIDKPNGTGIAHGLYCAKCGFWHKWLGKDELRKYTINMLKKDYFTKYTVPNELIYENNFNNPTAVIQIGSLAINIYNKTFTESQIKNMKEYFGWDVRNIEENK